MASTTSASSHDNNNSVASLFDHLDAATTDCLQSFQDGVAAAQKELGKEQERLQQLERSLRIAKDRNATMVRDKSDAERRVDALTVECARVRTLNVQLTDNMNKATQHVNAVREPRATASVSIKENDDNAAQLRSQYIQMAQSFVGTALQALSTNKHPKVLQSKLAALQQDITAARGRISTLRAASANRLSSVAVSQHEKVQAPMASHHHGSCSVELNSLMLELAALHEADANTRAEHHQTQRSLVAERDSLRDRVRQLTKQLETIEVQSVDVQSSYNALVNEVCGSACRRCGGALWTIGGDSGHE
ncbi:Hypothetical protein, putative [Bodo saltans]|uniref:Uncharacterized protein n=1 Tax=Bodo saltans TaxID=75058 RepID=A0A0S4JLR7_BODSA|nr:Hypothetical protein, putative [Bodo saltans]|eukprot:CUG90204.1 Hypothetical protein, putative [Bodo saltans]